MEVYTGRLLIYFSLLILIHCGYPPTGDEVQAGSVLLPASRRGRYLANIIRRQAVDGTGIKFHKDADRINAEAKKKVDVLSEELLPYIIAEQERRTTLHKRIMTAIQNGEKGVTIAEIRNKPPLIIRKGLLYRCPSNRSPKEPDGSGLLMCEDDIVPTQVMYDSCLSAEDKELFNADNKYFFCNRHKIEGPDLPRNGSTVISCAPIERTSLNYTMSRCTLEDTDDIVVHYRYYPDRTYKYVTELDPDHEVCDHWNPCQIGYIYSLPTADQATPASELWHDLVERNEEYERDEYIPAVPEDSMEESIYPGVESYTTSPRKVPLPNASPPPAARRTGAAPAGYEFIGVRMKRSAGPTKQLPKSRVVTKVSSDGQWMFVSLVFPKWKTLYYATYYAVIKDLKTGKEVSHKLVTLSPAATAVTPSLLMAMTGQKLNSTATPYKCNRCRIKEIMVRGDDGNIYNVDRNRYGVIEDVNTREQSIEVKLKELKAPDFGDYFMIIINGDGVEERVKILSVHSPEKDMSNEIQVPRVTESFVVGEHYDRTTHYSCNDCNMTEILCNGESVLSVGRVSIIPVSKMISLNFPRFEDSYSCVYMGIFKTNNGRPIKKVVAVLENNSPAVTISKVPVISPPPKGQPLEQEIIFTCADCTVSKIHVNGLELMNYSPGKSTSENAAFLATASSIAIHVSEFNEAFEGIYQAIFNIKEENVTKTIMEIEDGTPKAAGGSGTPAAGDGAISGGTTVAGDTSGASVAGDAASPAPA